MEIRPGDLEDSRVQHLLDAHQTHSEAHSPATSIHTLGHAALADERIDFFSAWEGGDVCATGALFRMSASEGEIKSMHVSEAVRGRGLGRAMIVHLETHARALGIRTLFLETGSMAAYAPARRMYEAVGFRLCPPFGTYIEDPNSVFMRKDLS